MSNQISRNAQGSQNNYGPNKAAFDRLTLSKNIPASGGNPAFGSQVKVINSLGNGLFLDRLNGSNITLTSGVGNYSAFQNPATMPYYTISANSALLNGATLICSKTDNVLAINACLPSGLVGLASTDIDYTLGIKVYNADDTVAATYAVEERLFNIDVPGNLPRDGISCALSAVVRVNAGQKLAIYGAVDPSYPGPETWQLFYKDKLVIVPGSSGSLTTLQCECCIDIQKM